MMEGGVSATGNFDTNIRIVIKIPTKKQKNNRSIFDF